MAQKNHGVMPSREMRRDVTRLIRQLGLRVAAQRLGIGERSLARIRDGRAVMHATLEVATSKLTASNEAAA